MGLEPWTLDQVVKSEEWRVKNEEWRVKSEEPSGDGILLYHNRITRYEKKKEITKEMRKYRIIKKQNKNKAKKIKK